jgi:hypothetical protein
MNYENKDEGAFRESGGSLNQGPLVTDRGLELLSIGEIVAKIEQLDEDEKGSIVAGALLVRELCRRIDAGMMGDNVKWYGWAREHIKASKSWLYQLHAIAGADDMAAASEEYRRHNRERQKRWRDKRRKAAEEAKRSADPERARLIRFAKNAPIDEVRWHLRQIGR